MSPRVGRPQSMVSRARIASTMRANSNAAKSNFSRELLGEYAGNEEVSAWLKQNAALLDSPNSDGSVPLSSEQIEAKDGFTLRENQQ